MFRLDNLCSALKNRTRTLQMAGPEDWIHFWGGCGSPYLLQHGIAMLFFSLKRPASQNKTSKQEIN